MHIIEVSPSVVAGCIVGAALVSLSVWSICARLTSAALPSTKLALAEHRIEHLSLVLSNSAAAMSPAEKAQYEAEIRERERKLPSLRQAAWRYRLRCLRKEEAKIDKSIGANMHSEADSTFLLKQRDEKQREIQELARQLRSAA